MSTLPQSYESLLQLKNDLQSRDDDTAKTAKDQLPSAKRNNDRTEHISNPALTALDLRLNLVNSWEKLSKTIENLAPTQPKPVEIAKQILQDIQDQLFIDFTDSCFLSQVFKLDYFLKAIFMARYRPPSNVESISRNPVVPIPTLMCVSPQRPPLDLYEALRVLDVQFYFDDIKEKITGIGNDGSLVSVWGKDEATRVVSEAIAAAEHIRGIITQDGPMGTGNGKLPEGFKQEEMQEKLRELGNTLRGLESELTK